MAVSLSEEDGERKRATEAAPHGSRSAESALACVEVAIDQHACHWGVIAASASGCRERRLSDRDLRAGGSCGGDCCRCLHPDVVVTVIADFLVAELVGRRGDTG